MTPTERAEKIVTEWVTEYSSELAIKEIAAQIEEAEREAVKARDDYYARLPDSEFQKVNYAEGFRAAREKAAELVESMTLEKLQGRKPPLSILANEIRGLK